MPNLTHHPQQEMSTFINAVQRNGLLVQWKHDLQYLGPSHHQAA